MSYLDTYLTQVRRLHASALASYDERTSKFKEAWAALKSIPIERRGEAREKLRVQGYMIDRMVKFYARGIELTERAIAIRDNPNIDPHLTFSGRGNKKLKRLGILAWNIPAGHACPWKGDCFGPCYALHGHYTMNPSLIAHMVENWAATDRPDFDKRMVRKIRHMDQKIFRVHDSGDFYSQDYVNHWAVIANAHPDRKFYAYTKAFYGLDLRGLDLPNFQLIQSVGGAHDSKIDMKRPHARIFKTQLLRASAGYSDGNASEVYAIEGVRKIGLVVHGRRKNFFDEENHGSRLPVSK